MKKNGKGWGLLLGLLVWTGETLPAQNITGVDQSALAGERVECRVPGHKVDRGGWIVNPVPHEMTFGEGALDFSKGFRLDDRRGCFADAADFLPRSKRGAKVTVDFGPRVAAACGAKERPGAYVLRIDGRGVVVTGYDERGAFYGLQTLRQLLESPAARLGTLPFVTVSDWPDMPYRGVVEGFYGTPWSQEVRLSLIDFYGKFKMNRYVYGPKDDPYHRHPSWREPYPAKEAENIRLLVDACRRNRVDFVWAVHPGADIRWNETDYKALYDKFDHMYELGVRAFAIFFDDLFGDEDGRDPRKQAELLNRLTAEFVKTKGDVAPLVVCPTDYNKSWANPTPEGNLAIYGRELDPSVDIFWTGDRVLGDLTASTTEWVSSRIARPAYFWWNFPVTDYQRSVLLMGPAYGLDTSLTDGDVRGIACNPMEHGEASKVALYGVADYTWNTAAYNPLDNWERGLKELMPGAAEAFRTFAIHSCDADRGYRREESWETPSARLDAWSEEDARKLWEEFDRVERAPAAIEAGCGNPALLKELRPWLAEFTKLGTRGKRALALARLYRNGWTDDDFRSAYVRNLMTPAERQAFEEHRSGTTLLHPVYEELMAAMSDGLHEPSLRNMRAVGSFANVQGRTAWLDAGAMFDNDTTTYYSSRISQKAGDWLGVDLGRVEPVREITILQGRHSQGDCDFFDRATVECSPDGERWTPLTGELTNRYRIHWTGDPVEARYVRLKRGESPRNNHLTVRVFEVNGSLPDFVIGTEGVRTAASAFDGRLSTTCLVQGALRLRVPAEVAGWTVMNRPNGAAPARFGQYDAAGNLLSEVVLDDPCRRIARTGGVAEVRIEGETELFEIIPHPAE